MTKKFTRRIKVLKWEEETACTWCGNPIYIGESYTVSTHDTALTPYCSAACLVRDMADTEAQIRQEDHPHPTDA